MRFFTFRWIRNSIFQKLLLVVFIAAILVNIFVSIFFHQLTSSTRLNFRKLVRGSAEFVVQSLGDPPNYAKAKRLGEDLGLLIRYEGTETAWSTSPDLPVSSDIGYEPVRSEFGMSYRTINLKRYWILKRKNEIFIIALDDLVGTVNSEILTLMLLIVLSLIFIGTYLVLRKIFHPIQSLKTGVQRVGEGKFDYQLHVASKDELGQLSHAFNLMTNRIKDILHSQEQLMLNVSHELRSPLTRMKIGMEFLPESTAKARIAEDIDLTQSMLLELLESARLESGHGELQMQETDLCKLITDLCRQLENRPPGIQCDFEVDALFLSIDSEQIRTVLRNLLENALKYSVDGPHPVLLSLKKELKSVRISIKDFGEGIPTEDVPFLFEPFYRVDKSRSKKTGGYGLGLSICKKIIEMHHGTIQLNSRIDIGTEIAVEIPLETIQSP